MDSSTWRGKMKINVTKLAGGMLAPFSDLDAERLSKFKTGEAYPIEIKKSRNPDFHGKVFAFFNFCFWHWKSDREFMDEAGQFDVFRRHMTVLAGYYDTFYNLNGDVRVEAKSISYASMGQQEFEELYNALIRVAVQKIFLGCDESIENKLMGFF